MGPFNEGDHVYKRGSTSFFGIVRASYKLSNGTEWCVVETYHGSQFFSLREDLRYSKRQAPLLYSHV